MKSMLAKMFQELRQRLLTPKEPRCVFWKYNFLGQIHVIRDFHVFGVQILIKGEDKEYFSCPLNFKTFENMSQNSKVMA